MNVVNRRAIEQCCRKHPDVRAALETWYADLSSNAYQTLPQLKARFGGADYVGNDRIVFNIKGNRYRVVVRINFKAQVVAIRFAGAHAEYDKIDAKQV